MLLKLEHLYNEIEHQNSVGNQIRLSVQFARDNIFQYLGSHPNTAYDVCHQDFNPHRTDFRTVKLSKQTLSSTGRVWMFYLSTRLISHSDLSENIRSVNRMMNGVAYSQGYTYVRLANLVQIASDLQVPIEVLLYGTTDIHAIAHFNYRHYERLPRLNRQFVIWQMKHYHTVAKLIQQAERHGKSGRKIAMRIGVSRQTIFNYLHNNSWFLKHRQTFDALCKLNDTKPLARLTYPLVTKKRLAREARAYARHINN